MEINILEDSKEKLEVEIKEETHTLLNALRKELWNDSHVKLAGYNIAHPLTAQPILIIETDGKESPKKALKSAIKRLSKTNENLLKKIKSLKL